MPAPWPRPSGPTISRDTTPSRTAARPAAARRSATAGDVGRWRATWPMTTSLVTATQAASWACRGEELVDVLLKHDRVPVDAMSGPRKLAGRLASEARSRSCLGRASRPVWPSSPRRGNAVRVPRPNIPRSRVRDRRLDGAIGRHRHVVGLRLPPADRPARSRVDERTRSVLDDGHADRFRRGPHLGAEGPIEASDACAKSQIRVPDPRLSSPRTMNETVCAQICGARGGSTDRAPADPLSCAQNDFADNVETPIPGGAVAGSVQPSTARETP